MSLSRFLRRRFLVLIDLYDVACLMLLLSQIENRRSEWKRRNSMERVECPR
jgi:hypothetical protein